MNGEKKETISLRKAEIRDAPVIAAFNVKMAAETEGKELEPEVVLRGVKAVIKDPHKGFYLVAETRQPESLVVGQLMVTFEWSDWRNRNFWWIQSVYVETGHRGRGIFGQLFRHLEEMARWRRDVAGLRLYVEKHNQQARGIYESLGMIPTSYDMLELEFAQGSGF